MEPNTGAFDESTNPLASGTPESFDRLIEAVGPAAMLVYIDSRMGRQLRGRVAAEDIWQESLLHAWRSRETCEWRGIASFKRWLRAIVENRIRNSADAQSAAKRGGGADALAIETSPLASTTPSRVAIHREQAAAMGAALDGLAPEVREVVYLRLFEECTSEEVAERLGLGVSAVQHRFRKGAAEYRRRLAIALETRPGSESAV